MQEYRPGSGSGNRRRRRHGQRRPYGSEAPKKKTGIAALVAGIASLFSGKKEKPVVTQEERPFDPRGRGRGRDRDRDRRRSRHEGGGDGSAGREQRSIREAAEAGPGEAVFRQATEPEQMQHAAASAESSEITTPRLYVGNLSYEASESDLFDLFTQAGAVRNVEIAMDKKTHKSKGFGFVEMESVTAAEAAQQKFQAYHLMGREISVMGAKSQRTGDEFGGRGDRGERRGRDRDRDRNRR